MPGRDGRWLILGAVVWTALVLLGCWLPGPRLPLPEQGWKLPHLDKLVHLLMFGGFAFFWLLAGRVDSRRLWTVALVGVALAVITELGQAHPAVRRDPSVLDALADTLGVALGLVAAWRLAGWLAAQPRGAGLSGEAA